MENEVVRVDFENILCTRWPNLKLPRIFTHLLKKIAREDDLNALFESLAGVKNVPFMDGCMKYFDLSVNVIGKENLPRNGHPCIFTSNHPLGALDAVTIGHVLGNEYNGNIKFYANELLTVVKPLEEMFLPIFKIGTQSRENVQIIRDFFHSDTHLITFPAGATSRNYGDKIIDLRWQKNFIQKSIEYQRDVVPLYFNARNSKFFYRLEKFRKAIRSKVNFEMIFLVDEMFKQHGNNYTLIIGKPIPWQTFDRSKTQLEWAAYVKEITYKLA